MNLAGGCLCGGVRFELTEPPTDAGYCHCTRCQRRTGGASSAQVRIAGETFRLLSGQELLAGWKPADGFEKCFCRACGTHLLARNDDGSQVSIRMSAFDEDPGVQPRWRAFTSYAAAWEPIPDDGLERYPEAKPHD